MAYVSGTPAGYFELETQTDGNIEIAYFGLLPSFIGHGLGGALLTAAVERAWALGARRVWVHTCSLDHPRALPGYQARGFRVFHIAHTEQDLPERPGGRGLVRCHRAVGRAAAYVSTAVRTTRRGVQGSPLRFPTSAPNKALSTVPGARGPTPG